MAKIVEVEWEDIDAKPFILHSAIMVHFSLAAGFLLCEFHTSPMSDIQVSTSITLSKETNV